MHGASVSMGKHHNTFDSENGPLAFHNTNGAYNGKPAAVADPPKRRRAGFSARRAPKAPRLPKMWPKFARWQDDAWGNVNKTLGMLAVLLTFAAPIYLWYESISIEGVESRLLALQTSTPQHPARQPAGQRAAASAVFGRRAYFRVEKAEPTAGPEPVAAADVPGLLERYSLVGILSGENSQAIVRANDSQVSIFVSVGERLGSYLVKRILPNFIVLEKDGIEVELRM